MSGNTAAAGHAYRQALSGNGRWVTFVGQDNFSDQSVSSFDRTTGGLERIDVPADGTPAGSVGSDFDNTAPSISDDGRFVAFGSVSSNLVMGDTNGLPDVFMRDRQAGTTQRISVASNGSQGNGPSGSLGISITSDGRFVLERGLMGQT